MQLKMRHVLFTVLAFLVVALIGCDELSLEKKASELGRHKPFELGKSEFISADPDSLFSSDFSLSLRLHTNPMSIEDGLFEGNDVYRIIDNGLIAYVNHLRGLQLIDISDIENPVRVGSLRFSGSATEVYAYDRYICVLMSDWQGYSGKRDGLFVEKYEGAVVLVIDVSDPQKPQIASRQNLPGFIRASQMVHSESAAALYVATEKDFGTFQPNQPPEVTILSSFKLTDDGNITPQNEINFGPFVTHIQTGSKAMLIACGHYERHNSQDEPCQVAIIDISSTEGVIVKGADITVAGHVFHESNMKLDDGILKIASGVDINNQDRGIKYLETFDVTDIRTPAPVDQLDFGETIGYAPSLFLEDKIFFVTRYDNEMYTVEIDEEGKLELKEGSGITTNSDYFKPVFDQTRLIGIRMDSYNTPHAEVRLYDITDLSLTDPLIAKGEFAIGSDWSRIDIERQPEFFKEKATFASVFENAVSVKAPNGVIETGLVILPFQGVKQGYGRMCGIQIVTFSDQTITYRGVIEKDNPVKQSYFLPPSTMANLSPTDLVLFSIADPDQPVESGYLNISPNYDDFFIFGNYGVRHKFSDKERNPLLDAVDAFGLLLSISNPELFSPESLPQESTIELPRNTLEVIALDNNPEKAMPLATLDVPATAQVFQVKDLIVTVEMAADLFADIFSDPETAETQTHIQVYDFKDPIHPKKAGTFKTDKLKAHNDFITGMSDKTAALPVANQTDYTVYAMENSLIFFGITEKNESAGAEKICTTTAVQDIPLIESSVGNAYVTKPIMIPREDNNGAYDPDVQTEQDVVEEWYSGAIECRNLEDQEPACSGVISVCKRDANECVVCEEIDPDTIDTETQCTSQNARKTWYEMTLNVVDLTDPETPELFLNSYTFDDNEQIQNVLPVQDKLYCHYSVFDSRIDQKDYTRHYVKIMDVSNPSKLTVGPGINIPGWLLHVDKNTLFTRDVTWKGILIESSLNRLVIKGDRAVLKARHAFEGQDVFKIIVDNRGYAYVSHYPSRTDNGELYCPRAPLDPYDPHHYLSVFDTRGHEFDMVSSIETNTNAIFRDVAGSRALFAVSGGVLAVNLLDPEAPFTQAFFPMLNWPRKVVAYDSHIAFAGEKYGLYSIGADEITLSEK